VPVGQAGEGCRLRAQLVPDAVDGVAQAEHQGGVEDVLARQPSVQPPGGGRAGPQASAEQPDERDHRVAPGLGARGDVVGVRRGQQPGQGGAGLRRRDPGLHQRGQPGLLDRDHRRQDSGVREQVAGPIVARPEQVRHRGGWPG
jgi:hypothetical protein